MLVRLFACRTMLSLAIFISYPALGNASLCARKFLGHIHTRRFEAGPLVLVAINSSSKQQGPTQSEFALGRRYFYSVEGNILNAYSRVSAKTNFSVPQPIAAHVDLGGAITAAAAGDNDLVAAFVGANLQLVKVNGTGFKNFKPEVDISHRVDAGSVYLASTRYVNGSGGVNWTLISAANYDQDWHTSAPNPEYLGVSPTFPCKATSLVCQHYLAKIRPPPVLTYSAAEERTVMVYSVRNEIWQLTVDYNLVTLHRSPPQLFDPASEVRSLGLRTVHPDEHGEELYVMALLNAPDPEVRVIRNPVYRSRDHFSPVSRINIREPALSLALYENPGQVNRAGGASIPIDMAGGLFERGGFRPIKFIDGFGLAMDEKVWYR